MFDSSPLRNEQYEQMLRAAEDNKRAIWDRMELVLGIGDFQKEADRPIDPREFIRITAERINAIIQFDISAIYFIDQQTAAPELACCIPDDLQNELEDQFEFLIQHGYIAWALREQRGITVYSHKKRFRVLMHTISTYSRVRGIFIGLFPINDHRLPDGSLQSLSLFLRNAANTLESLEYIAMFHRQNAELHTRVDEKVGELRRLDHQLFNARKMDAIATLAGGVAHQYNNALAVMVGNLELIRIAVPNGQDFSKNLGHLEAVAQRMQELTTKLLAYARGGKHLPQTIFIDTLVQEAVKGARKSLENDIEITLAVPTAVYAVHVDVDQMQLVLSAIVTNAIEALETNGRIRIDAIKCSITEPTSENRLELAPGDYVILRIEDNGRGMDAVTRQQMFEPFFTTKFLGRGLSMAAASGIVKNHHGEIEVDSELGQGTVVRVCLPLTS